MLEQDKGATLESQYDIRHLLDEYGDLVLTLCRRILVDVRLAEEATQDTFIKAYKNLDKFREESSMKTWIYRIAYNTAIDYRRRKRHPVSDVQILPENSSETDVKNAQTRLEEEEDYKMVHTAIQRLPADQAALITLYYLEEKNIREVCEITGLTPSNVKIKLFRARKQLADILMVK